MRKAKPDSREVQSIAGGNRLTHARVAGDREFMERLLRDANRARSQAIYCAFAALFRALIRVASNGRFSASIPARHPCATLFHAGRAAQQ